MPSATLSIGSAGYDLLEILDGGDQKNNQNENLKVQKTGSAYSIRSKTGGSIENLGIDSEAASGKQGSDTASNISIFSGLDDFQASLGKGGDTLNIFGNVSGGRFELDDSGSSYAGNDLLTIRGNLTSGTTEETDANRIYAGSGNDTIRIAGNVEDSFIYLGEGNDSLSIDGSAARVDVKGDGGNDYIEFRGDAESVRVQSGTGSDTVIFRGWLNGSSAEQDSNFGDPGRGSVSDPGNSAVDLGSGNDSLVLGNGASNAEINSGAGYDTLALKGTFENTRFHLDGTWDNALTGGDRLTSTAQSNFFDTSFTSNNSSGDTLVFGSNNIFDNSSFYLSNNVAHNGVGLGTDSLVFGSNSSFVDTTISTGYGSDTIVFGANTTFDNLRIDLGSDNDIIRFATGTDLSGVTITGANTGDLLYIGMTAYEYKNNDFYSGTTLWKQA